MDIFTRQKRSEIMAKVSSKDTKPEIIVRKFLFARGFRFRKNVKNLPGKPDIVLTKYRICIFVDSEFFHGKNFESGYKSNKYSSLKDQLEHSNNAEFWLNKIQGNIERDRKIEAELHGKGWFVLRFWSKDILYRTDECVRTIDELIFSLETYEI